MRTSNPTISEKTFNSYSYITGVDPSTLMTVQGTINKTGILLLLTLGSAAASWHFGALNPGLLGTMLLGACITGLILGLVICFKKETAPVAAPLYALVEGVLLGAISMLMNASYPGIALQAVAVTASVFGVMLLLYKTKVLQATPMFTKVVVIATCGICLMYLISLGMSLFGVSVPYLNDATPIGIGISVVICIVAALNFILDFDLIETGAENGAPKFMEWYGAFALLVTMIWLYIEVLKLLRKLRN